MTTPAETTDVKTPLVAEGVKRTRVSNGSELILNIQCGGRGIRNLRPASGTSPVRADGSRAPRGFDHRWGRMDPPVVRVKADFTGLGIRYLLDGMFPLMGMPDAGIIMSDPMRVFAAQAGISYISETTGTWPSNVTSKAVTALRNEIIGSKAQWGVTLGEMKQTVKGIETVCNDILRVLEFLGRRYKRSKQDIIDVLLDRPVRKRRGNMTRERHKAEKEILSQWLGFQFSVKPTLMDIQQSAEALSWLLFDKKQPARFTIRKGATEEWRTTVDTVFPRGGTYRLGTLHTPVYVTAGEHYSLVYEVEPTTTTTYQQLGLTNVGSVLWELTQFSWMVDYVVGVGDWISSMTKLDGARFIEGSRSRIGRLTSAGRVGVTPLATTHSISGISGKTVDYEIGRFTRTVLTGFPGPAVHPPFRSKMNITRMANVLAVVSGLAAGRSNLG